MGKSWLVVFLFFIGPLVLSGSAYRPLKFSVSRPFHDLLAKSISFAHSYQGYIETKVTRKYLDIISPKYSVFMQTTLVELRTHMNELCPNNIEECWCGFVNKPGDRLQPFATRPFLMMQICCSDTKWRKNKEIIVQEFLPLFSQVRDRDGEVYDYHDEWIQHQDDMFNLPYNSSDTERTNRTATLENIYSDLNIYKHDESLCAEEFKWCWCGFINTLEEYHGLSIKDKEPLGPRVLIDCRPFEKRPFEKRNCTTSSPLRRMFFGIGPSNYPCGYHIPWKY